MEFRWYCRRMKNIQDGEKYPTDENGDLLYENGDEIPDGPRNDTSGGCFGNGPGCATAIFYLIGMFKRDLCSYEPIFLLRPFELF